MAQAIPFTRPTVLTSACRPYLANGPGPSARPVHVADVTGRLTRNELEMLACWFAGTAPAAFEEALLALWFARQDGAR